MEQISITSAYMWALVIMVVFFLTAVIIANLILFKPNNTGTTNRRIWFWILCVSTGVVGFVINYFIGQKIDVPTLQSNFYMHAGIATVVSMAIYIIAGFVVSKIFPNSKVGTWF